MTISDLLGGFATALEPQVLLLAFLGCLAGTLIGVLPGLGPVTAVAILFPLTTYLDPAAGVIVLAAIYYGGMYGGSTTAILLNIPGEVASVPTAIEGFQLTRQGRAGSALAMAAITSFVAGIAGTIGVLLIGPTIARLALYFGPAEMLGLLLFSLVTIIGVSSASVLRGIASCGLGLLLASVGVAQTTSDARLTFGSLELLQGFDVVAVMMGLFGLAEVLRTILKPPKVSAEHRVGSLRPTRTEFTSGMAAGARGTVSGFFLGLLPGMIPSIASFLSYASERRRALRRGTSRFGKGAMEGVAGPEAANNAAAMGGFVPLLSLGIPTGATMALVLAAMLVQGIVPGPQLFSQHPDFVAAVIASFFIANVILVILNLPLVGIWARITKIPTGTLMAVVACCCLLGAYLSRNSFLDVWVCVIAGILGWLLTTWQIPIAPLVMGLILGPTLEITTSQSFALSPTFFVQRPIFVGFVVLIIISLVISTRIRRRGMTSDDD
ncbi:tripartite tricarboxylate transporter permease [Amycolatopsis thermoflava]|uniref:Putative tricarboxylic transport membrane protein n=1 Tax=Amycolatopsis thermoflava TaxID=84480 RepID=A0A3N2GPP9_9PSEU|nr:tripartite tricarboxylate transporter permease [Amycolatopsis thermoflava]ROS38493.1 putative tricarboxylic transport membrane protein [Amycolatopsis thermoflava]